MCLYHDSKMLCFCGNVTKAMRFREKAKCVSFCPDSGTLECPGAEEITLYDTYCDAERKSSPAFVPTVITLILVVMVFVIIFISIKWRKHIKGKKQHSEIRFVPVIANKEFGIFQTQPKTCSSNYSTIPDPYNYVDIGVEGSVNNQRTCDNYSNDMPNFQYDLLIFSDHKTHQKVSVTIILEMLHLAEVRKQLFMH